MYDDDRFVGRVLSRRELMHLFGASGTAALVPWTRTSASALPAMGTQAAAISPGCVVKPEMTEGPYFIDNQLVRADIRSDPSTGVVKNGARLSLTLAVSEIAADQCRVLPDALVDIWQCDAQGAYAGVADTMAGFDTVGQSFLRGQQVTDANGIVRFTTIYPGWYTGRAVHIHFKIRTPAAGGTYEFTSQWFFDETLTDRVFEGAAYARPRRRDTVNSTDSIYRNGGDQLLLPVVAVDDGFAASFTIGLDLSDTATGAPDSEGRGGRGRGRGGPGRGRSGQG